jgi:transcriptional regulator with XRE-family HTH domain
VSDFANEFERARVAAGITRQEAADAAGLSGPGLRRATRPDGNPTLRTMERLASAVGCRLVTTMVRVYVVPPAPRREAFVSAAPLAGCDDIELEIAA